MDGVKLGRVRDRMGKVRGKGQVVTGWNPKAGAWNPTQPSPNGTENPGNVTAPDPERLVLGTLYENLEPDCPDLNSGYPVNSWSDLEQLPSSFSVSQFPINLNDSNTTFLILS